LFLHEAQRDTVVDEKKVLEYQKMYLQDEIGFDHFTEAYVVEFAQSFRKYRTMTVNRLEAGI
jgi:hypothetical protein